MNCLCFCASCPAGSPPPTDMLPSPREVRAGGKTFFFDVERNDRGIFVRLSEVSSSTERDMLYIYRISSNRGLGLYFLQEGFCPGF